MRNNSIKGNAKLGESIRNRRIELGMTIEEAASKAGVGTKSWYRYESGEAIRSDKAKGICKALNWYAFPGEDSGSELGFDIETYRDHEAWSSYLAKKYGEAAAISFAIGSDLLYDYVKEDLEALSGMPRGTHIGQLSSSMLKDILPEQFLMRYDYDFVYRLKLIIANLRRTAKSGREFAAHSVIEELAIYSFMREATFLIECTQSEMEEAGIGGLDIVDEWAFDLFDDSDIVLFLFSNIYLTEEDSYHFDQWYEDQFYIQ